MTKHGIEIPLEAINEFCSRNKIRKLALFGSILRDDFGPDSDVDMLVEYEPRAGVGLWGMAEAELQLSQMLGRTVDLRTPEDLSRYFREEVLTRAEVVYAA